MARAGRAAEEEDEKAYVGRGYTGVLGFYAGEEVDTFCYLKYL